MDNSSNKEEYNEIPVIYCKSCLSLHIENFLSNRLEDEYEGKIHEYDYCKDCGSTDLGVCTIKEYQKLYIERYGYTPVKRKKVKLF